MPPKEPRKNPELTNCSIQLLPQTRSHSDAIEWALHVETVLTAPSGFCLTSRFPDGQWEVQSCCGLLSHLFLQSQESLGMVQNAFVVCASQAAAASGEHTGWLTLTGSMPVNTKLKLTRAATMVVRLVRARTWICPLPHSPTLLCKASSMVTSSLPASCMGPTAQPWTYTFTPSCSLECSRGRKDPSMSIWQAR